VEQYANDKFMYNNKKKPQTRLFDMLGVGNRGKRAYYRLGIKSAVYKKLFWTTYRTSAPPDLGEGNP